MKFRVFATERRTITLSKVFEAEDIDTANQAANAEDPTEANGWQSDESWILADGDYEIEDELTEVIEDDPTEQPA